MFNDALEPQEAQWEAERTARKERMAPYNKLMDDVGKEDKEKEAARLTQVEIFREKFAEASRNKNPIRMGDHGSICDAELEEEDKEFRYHLSDGSAEEEGEDYANWDKTQMAHHQWQLDPSVTKKRRTSSQTG